MLVALLTSTAKRWKNPTECFQLKPLKAVTFISMAMTQPKHCKRWKTLRNIERYLKKPLLPLVIENSSYKEHK